MNAAHHLAAAEHALSTDQPNLAVLHMRRASEYVAEDRAQTRVDHRAATPNLELARAMRKIGARFSDVIDGMSRAFEGLAKGFAIAAKDTQDAYALAGPSKGGAS